MWSQVYDPFGNMGMSALVEALPVFGTLASTALYVTKAH